MTKVEQLRKRLEKLQEQILREEVNEITGSTTKIVMADGSMTDDYPLITCPVCGEKADFTEAQLNIDGNMWTYFEGFCSVCHTDFRIGEVPDRCALCHEPLPCDPHEDVNELYHHWCKKDGQYYCTPCFMQLFFNDYIDLSSDNPEVRDDSLLVYSLWYTHIGNSVAPYCSRLVAKGYQEVAVVEEWDEINQVCQQIVNEGRRYLVLSLSVSSDEPEGKNYYIIYRSGAGNHSYITSLRRDGSIA